MSIINKIFLSIFIIVIILISCARSFDPFELDRNLNCDCIPENNSINILFKYGIGAKNILNTYDCTYTKDMIRDPSISICFELNDQELDSIFYKMNEINFFDYPDTFIVKLPYGPLAMVSPSATYYLNVEFGNEKKELYWNDDPYGNNLRELIYYIIDLLESKEEIKYLPEPRGGYV